jgi:thymidine kinase
MEIASVADQLAHQGKRVIVAGLDLDFTARPFDSVAHLLCIAEYITKTLAICVVCGNPASRSQRLAAGGTDRIVVGDVQAYEAHCRKCFRPTPV